MYISIREFHKQGHLGELSNGSRPLSYATILKRVRQHVEEGNQAKVIEIGEGNTFRLAVPQNNIKTLADSIIKNYQK